MVLKIDVPQYENKSGWKLEGQPLSLESPLTYTVAQLKQQIKDALQIPPNKQKLRVEGLPALNDKKSLAYYNIVSGTVVELRVKERGGRKK